VPSDRIITVKLPVACALALAAKGGQTDAHPPVQFDTLMPSALYSYNVMPLGVAKPGDPRIVCVIAGVEDAGGAFPPPGGM
jgi:hypothetical protein